MLMQSIFFLCIGFIAGWQLSNVMKRIPAQWLCDYGQVPADIHLPEKRPGIKIRDKVSGAVFIGSMGYVLSFQTDGMNFVLNWAKGLLWIAIFCVLLIISRIDREYMIIPDQFVIALLVCGMWGNFLLWTETDCNAFFYFFARIGAGLLFSAVYLIPGLLISVMCKKEAIGMGDIKLLFAVGVCFGIEAFVIIIGFSAVLCSLFFSIQLALRRRKPGEYTPMGPWISSACVVYLLMI